MCYREIVSQLERQHRASGRREFTCPAFRQIFALASCSLYLWFPPQPFVGWSKLWRVMLFPSSANQPFRAGAIPFHESFMVSFRWCAVRRGFKTHLVPTPCPGQGHLPLDTLVDIWAAQELRQTAQLSIAAVKLGYLPCKMMLSHCFGNMTLNFIVMWLC